MLRNLVNRHDFTDLMTNIARDGWRTVARRIARTRRQRVEQIWADPLEPDDQWWAVPAVQKRWTRMTAHGAGDYASYVTAKYLAHRLDLRGLFLGCGTGWGVLRWAETGSFQRIDALDISSERVAAASRRAATSPRAEVVHFTVADVQGVELTPAAYDVVFAEQALHHFAPLRRLLERVRRSLRPDGLLLVDEYVGPNRNQWTARQLEAANELLAIMPVRYRVMQDGRLKTSVVRPSRLRMLLRDPSEAVESEQIRPLIHELFEVLEERGYGGALLHPLLARIAHNFVASDPGAEALLEHCFAVEDRLLRAGDISHDFVVAVCRSRMGVVAA